MPHQDSPAEILAKIKKPSKAEASALAKYFPSTSSAKKCLVLHSTPLPPHVLSPNKKRGMMQSQEHLDPEA